MIKFTSLIIFILFLPFALFATASPGAQIDCDTALTSYTKAFDELVQGEAALEVMQVNSDVIATQTSLKKELKKKKVELITLFGEKRFNDLLQEARSRKNIIYDNDQRSRRQQTRERERTLLPDQAGEITSDQFATMYAQISPDGLMIATTGSDNVSGTSHRERFVAVWDSTSHKLIKTLAEHKDQSVKSAHFSPDSKLIVVRTLTRVSVWDIATGKMLKENASIDDIDNAEFSPDGRQILITAKETFSQGFTNAMLWDWRSDVISPIQGDNNRIYSAKFHPKGHLFITASALDVQIFNKNQWNSLYRLPKDKSIKQRWARSAEWSPDGRYIAIGYDKGDTEILDAETFEVIHHLKKHTNFVRAARFSPDGQFLATGSGDGQVILWSVETGEFIKVLGKHSRPVRTVEWHPNGQTVISGGDDNHTYIWRVFAQLDGDQE